MLKSGKNLFDDFGTAKPQIQQSVDRLAELEGQINRNFFAAAEALREIKDTKLYLQVADTWEQYCKERLGRGIEAVRRQIKALEYSESLQQKSSIGGEPALEIKDLRKVARIPAAKIQEVLKENSAATAPEIIARSQSDYASALETAFTKKSPVKTKGAQVNITEAQEDDLLDEIITRIRRARANQGFLKALKEWLDDSGI